MSDVEKLPKWRNVGYAEFSKSKRSVRIWLSRKFKAEYCYIGVQALRNLLDGKKNRVSIYVLGDDSG